MISYVIPTRNRHGLLARTVATIGALGDHREAGGAEIVVIDNASSPPVDPRMLAAGPLPVRVITLRENLGAAARNIGVEHANPASRWIVMLDDDSHPTDTRFASELAHQPRDVAAVMADVRLPEQNCREAGGLPEVFIGCGVAFRREAFMDAGGYDPAFGYYAEEYDLAARFLLSGWRVAFEPTFRVDHHKVGAGRDMDLILSRLVRNNGWVAQRYAPDELRRDELREVRRRYRRIAEKESARRGYAHGLLELRATLRSQARSPMAHGVYDRFTGLAAAVDALASVHAGHRFSTAALVEEGKNAWVVREALCEIGVRIVTSPETADALVVGTMSPGPMLDALEKWLALDHRVIAPWRMAARTLEARRAA